MKTTRREFLAASGLAAISVASAQTGQRRLTQFDPEVKKLLATMSLDQKIGQMTQPDQQHLANLDDIEKYHLGSLLSGGDSDPKTGNDLRSWTEMYERYQKRALAAKPRIPLLYGVDSVHGNSNVIGAVIFPHNINLGCTRNAKLIEEIGRITAAETRATGMNWAFAPCVTAPQDIRWGRTYEGFSEDPAIIGPLGAAATRGLQRNNLADPMAVLACVKHFAGDGGTTFGTGMMKNQQSGERYPLDRGDTRGPEDVLFKLHIAQYIPSIQDGAGSIMPSYSSWNGEKASGHRGLLTDILKNKLAFQGFLISDYNALGELPGSYKQQIERSINAGMDMVMVPDRYQEFFNLLKQNVNEGKVPQSRIDDAVVRILRVKFAMGLMDPKTNVFAPAAAQKSFGSAEHRAVGRQAVRESMVILKNDRRVLPLAKTAKKIVVAGRAADDIGMQCGGWTITWQGKTGPTTKGTTILQAIRNAAPSAQISYDRAGNGAQGATVGVAVIGETPYAEMNGDNTDLRLTAEDVAAVKNLKKSGIPVVAIIVSGRPLVIDEILGDVDAVVAAFWPGTEGDGVADILFGAHKPSGKLSFTWPAAGSTSFRRGDSGYKTLYKLGHGLTF